MNKLILSAVVRHLLGFAGAWLATKGVDVDQGTIANIEQLIMGVLMGGGALAWSLGSKKNVTTVVETPALVRDVESVPEAPKGFFLSEASLKMMKGVDADLVNVMKAAIVASPYDFKITEGLRSAERQNQLIKANKSWTSHSKHQDGKAVDIMAYDENGNGTWEGRYYDAIAEHVKNIAYEKGVSLVWGGDWKKYDAVHFEVNK